MYNSKKIDKFIKKVVKEANKEAQKIFNKYNNQLIKMIQEQIHGNDRVIISMGSTCIWRKVDDKEYFAGEHPGRQKYNRSKMREKVEEMEDVINTVSYHLDELDANFPINNTGIIHKKNKG